MSSLFFIGADRADPMPGKNERQGRSANIFFFREGSLQGHSCKTISTTTGEVAFLNERVSGSPGLLLPSHSEKNSPVCVDYLQNII
jgi:hypothetical protein